MLSVAVMILALLALVPPLTAYAGRFAIPEKVEIGNAACGELARLGAKYQIDGIFSPEFREGKVCYSRVELAAAVVLLTEKMADKVVKEGPGSVDHADLVLVDELQEELRAEMLLARTRTFQQRNEDLGTKLHALSKNISMSGGLVGVLQGSLGNRPTDHVDAVGRGDLVFNFSVGEKTIAVIDVESTGGDGLDRHIGNFSKLDNVAGSTGDRVRFRQAWVEHTAVNDRITLTAGKIDLTSYFDANAVANDENSQFLAGAFTNSPVLGVPDIGPGARLQARLAESLTFGIGYGAGDASGSDVIDHGYGIAELDYKVKLGELEGNYRIYGSIDGARADGENKLLERNAVGGGVSFDQQVSGPVALFFRYGVRERNAYATRGAWSAGGQYTGLIPGRKDDVLAVAYGQILPGVTASQEKLAELYYKVKLSEQISITPVAQYLINPEGDRSRPDVKTLGVRTQVTF
ncbi:carbohydrate porin [Geomonas sp. Red875]|uniref:Carbohydrate porin n=2 Tax=Geomesophilobacter sediminis TaxID=2798584 RepID=A0A8J7M399_9BACT|nr:carbohydrate porin [Geomesophilobacter sediminis]